MPVSRHVTLFVGHDDQQVYSADEDGIMQGS